MDNKLRLPFNNVTYILLFNWLLSFTRRIIKQNINYIYNTYIYIFKIWNMRIKSILTSRPTIKLSSTHVLWPIYNYTETTLSLAEFSYTHDYRYIICSTVEYLRYVYNRIHMTLKVLSRNNTIIFSRLLYILFNCYVKYQYIKMA